MSHINGILKISNPQNRDFQIPGEYGDILHDSGVDDVLRILAIGDMELVALLRIENVWFGDGTFDGVLTIYFQLQTFQCKIGNRYPPCIYFLLPNKTQPTYTRMVEILHHLVPQANPEEILQAIYSQIDQFRGGFFTFVKVSRENL